MRLLRQTGSCSAMPKYTLINVFNGIIEHMHGSRAEDRRSGPPPPKNHINIGFLSKIGPDRLKTTKLPSQQSMLGHNRHASNAISMAFRLQADDGPLIVVFGSYHPSSSKKRCQCWTPLTKLSGSAHGAVPYITIQHCETQRLWFDKCCYGLMIKTIINHKTLSRKKTVLMRDRWEYAEILMAASE